MRTAQGWQLVGVRIPADAISASVAQDGTVSIATNAGTRSIAHLRVAEFAAPEHLRSIDGTVFTSTLESGKPRLVAPGTESGPKLRFGMLEQSNVTIIEAMMQILTAQRAYEANAKGIQAADEMLRIANNLQRG